MFAFILEKKHKCDASATVVNDQHLEKSIRKLQFSHNQKRIHFEFVLRAMLWSAITTIAAGCLKILPFKNIQEKCI